MSDKVRANDLKDMLERSKGLDIHNEGKRIIANMTNEERAVLRSKCHTLHFVKLLNRSETRLSF